MSRLRDQALQRVGAVFVIALTLVPLALSGHHHKALDAGASRSCAVCVATHHAPGARLPLVPRVAPVLHSFQLPETRVVAPAHVFRPFRTGRAPPALFTARVV
jgi:hypothetical protein